MNVNIYFSTDGETFEVGGLTANVHDILKQVKKALRDSCNETTIVRPLKDLNGNRRIGTINIAHDTPVNEL